MGWLNSRKPQGFHHTYIYIDERNEAVRRLRQSRVEAAADEASLTAAGDGAASSADAAKPSAASAKPSADSAKPSAGLCQFVHIVTDTLGNRFTFQLREH